MDKYEIDDLVVTSTPSTRTPNNFWCSAISEEFRFFQKFFQAFPTILTQWWSEKNCKLIINLKTISNFV